MPVYEFRCIKCRKAFKIEKAISAYDPSKVSCPKCRTRSVQRIISAVSVITSKKS